MSQNTGVGHCFRCGLAELAHFAARVRRGHGRTGSVQSHGRKNLSVSPLPNWMRTLTALWLCIPWGGWYGIEVYHTRICTGTCVCACVCVCVGPCVYACTSPPPGQGIETPSVGVSEPLHGH